MTILKDATPVSDVDLLVVGGTIDDLRLAARELSAAFAPFRCESAPFFKLGLKLRRSNELTEEFLTANELAALVRGQLLSGAHVQFEMPTAAWYQRQANLVVPTRLLCNFKQRQLLRYNSIPLSRYLAARTLLDIPTITFTGIGDLGGSYSQRLRRFERRLQSFPLAQSEQTDLRRWLRRALKTKRNPEHYDCGTQDEAERMLVAFAARCGVTAKITDGALFWTSQRPLDVRDWELRQIA